MTNQPQKEAAAHALMLRRLMPPPAAAEYLGGIVVGTLAKWRHYGCGPEYIRVGSRIMYDQSALDAWLDERRCSSTSEAA